MLKKVYKIRICYKSGIVIEEWFTKFDIKHNGSNIHSIEYRTLVNRIPLFINLDYIESVWVIGTKYSIKFPWKK